MLFGIATLNKRVILSEPVSSLAKRPESRRTPAATPSVGSHSVGLGTALKERYRIEE